MAQYQPVPVAAAAAIANQFEKQIVIVTSIDRPHGLVHMTTYGVEPVDKIYADRIGKYFISVSGVFAHVASYEDFRNDFDAADFKRALELLARAKTEIGPRADSWTLYEAIGAFFADRESRKRGAK